ncbi:MAG TPA: phosphatase PAP2 family protein [Burkholderiales bacterium]|nr:phosphatase PAP2 family protein [Burkholderiales bacterium]
MRPLENRWQRLLAWDLHWCLRMNRASGVPWICALFRAASRLGDGMVWYALMAALLLADDPRAVESVLSMFMAGVVGLAIYKALKRSTSRPRPYQVQRRIRLATPPLDHFSFPSGHTLHAVSLSIIAIAYYPFLAPLLITITVLIAASRVILGLHYPSDVFAGTAIGVALAAVILMLV